MEGNNFFLLLGKDIKKYLFPIYFKYIFLKKKKKKKTINRVTDGKDKLWE